MSKFKILLLASLLALPSAGEAAIWYVATTGSDNNTCTQAQNPATPKKTIRAGMACAGTWASPGSGAGDTVIVSNAGPCLLPHTIRFRHSRLLAPLFGNS